MGRLASIGTGLVGQPRRESIACCNGRPKTGFAMPFTAWNAHASAILEKALPIRADHRPWAGFVRQSVQIAASHDLTLVVGVILRRSR